MQEFRGILVPIVTPFTDGDEIDYAALAENLDALVEGGVSGVIPAGSTGEAMSLRADEYHELLRFTIKHIAGRVAVIAGCSANATRDVIANCQEAERLGADGLMTVHPFYSLPNADELYAHYRAVAEAIHLPLIIYNNPTTSGVDTSPELLAALSKLDHIDYVKDSTGDATRVIRTLQLSEGRLRVLCGTDNLALENFVDGAIGWVAGAANALPAECVELYRLAAVERRYDAALSHYLRLHPFLTLAETGGRFVQVNKAAVEFVGRHAGQPRPPLLPLDAAALERVHECVTTARTGHAAAKARGGEASA